MVRLKSRLIFSKLPSFNCDYILLTLKTQKQHQYLNFPDTFAGKTPWWAGWAGSWPGGCCWAGPESRRSLPGRGSWSRWRSGRWSCRRIRTLLGEGDAPLYHYTSWGNYRVLCDKVRAHLFTITASLYVEWDGRGGLIREWVNRISQDTLTLHLKVMLKRVTLASGNISLYPTDQLFPYSIKMQVISVCSWNWTNC